MNTSRKIADLHPKVATMAWAFVKKCADEGIDVIITSTLRDNEAQAALYAQGRTAPGKIVTNAKPGYSYHNFGLAFDFVPVKDGKAQWNDLKLFQRCGEIGESLGLEWAGRWESFKEYAHLQWTGGLTLSDLRQGKRP